jgi:diguanylate cyclase (GGDEF)-like protein/PAS domain S-box-containing protein
LTSIALDRSRVRPDAAAIVPFTVFGLVGAASCLGLLRDASTPLLGSLLVVTALSGTAEIISIRRRRTTWITPVGSYLYFVMFVLLRHATGGADSVMSPMVAIPILWLALFGTRFHLAVAAVLTFAAFLIAPVLESTAIDGADLRRALLWTTFAVTVAPLVHRLVSQLEERTRAERAAGARLRGVLQGATMSSLITTDLNGIITSVNNGTEDLLGWSAEELVGRDAVTVLHEREELERVADELQVDDPGWVLAHLAQERAASRIWLYRRKDGEQLHVRLAVTELRDDDNRIVGHLAIGIDATENVRASAALAESEQRWRLVMDHLPDMTVLVLDEDLRVSMVAGAGAAKHGVGGHTDALGPISTPANVELLTGGVRAALAGQAREATIDLRATATGADHVITFCALPQQSGERATVLALARDVSVERARERAVAEARDRAEKLVLSAPHGIAVMRRDGTLSEANPALLAMLGRRHDELVGAALTSLVTPEDQALERRLAAAASTADALAASAPHHTRWTARRGDATQVHLSVDSTPLDDGTDAELLLTFTDVSERLAHEAELAWWADHDALTGLTNRRRFAIEVDHHLRRCRRSGPRGALLVVDLDHFKTINDAEGHAAGDRVLVAVAQSLSNAVRDTDVVARLGGDEFAVLLTDAGREEAERVAERVVVLVGATARSHHGSAGGTVTASVGIAMVEADSVDPGTLLAGADRQMYDAKRRGRNQWVSPSDDRPAVGRPTAGGPADRRSRLADAGGQRDMELHLQPIWDVATRRVVGAEALLRLIDGPTIVLPQPFVTRAERLGLIGELDCWTVGEAVRVLALMQDVAPDTHIGVNVSGATLGDPAYESALRTALSTYGVDASSLLLEVTETAAITDLDSSVAFARRMVADGTRLALDDFGTGYASLACLRRLPFAFVKIDGAFVEGSVHDPTDRTILASTVDLARRLGVQTVAEHVADEETLATVRAEGVDLAQGHLVGPAVPWEQFVERHVPSAQPPRVG